MSKPKWFGFGKQSTGGDARTKSVFWPVITADTLCTCGHTHFEHGYVDGFWTNEPDTEPCAECDCEDFDRHE